MADIRSIVTVEKEVGRSIHMTGLKVAGCQPIVSAIQQAWWLLDVVLDALEPLSEDESKVFGAIAAAATARALLQSVDDAIADAVRPEQQAEFHTQTDGKENRHA